MFANRPGSRLLLFTHTKTRELIGFNTTEHSTIHHGYEITLSVRRSFALGIHRPIPLLNLLGCELARLLVLDPRVHLGTDVQDIANAASNCPRRQTPIQIMA